jgi:hypothetical protein
MIEWLDDVWSRAHVAQIVEGGEDAGPIADRSVLAELRATTSITAARRLTTYGRFTGDICRCHGGPTIVLYDATQQVLATAGIHGHGSVSWERSRFRNDLLVSDPIELHLFLAEHGVPGRLTPFLGLLADLLDLHETDPQFRPAGQPGEQQLAKHGVPEVLRPILGPLTGQQAAELTTEQSGEVRRLFTSAFPAPVDAATVLLSWLGRLSIPNEALWGEGVLVRQLLADLPSDDIAAAAAGRPTGEIAMGAVNLAMHAGDDGRLAAAIRPALHLLFPQPASADG